MAGYAGWMRNYKAMNPMKLAQCLQELENQSGNAYDRVLEKGGLISEHLSEARGVASDKGWTTQPVNAPGSAMPLTEPMECSACGRVERHFVDDYVCRTCREELDGD